MKRRIVILPAALDDLVVGQRFYEDQAMGLGEYFVDSLSADIEALRLHGGVHRKVYTLQRYPARRSPFTIFYRMNGDTVSVIGVLDSRQDPEALRRALRGR